MPLLNLDQHAWFERNMRLQSHHPSTFRRAYYHTQTKWSIEHFYCNIFIVTFLSLAAMSCAVQLGSFKLNYFRMRSIFKPKRRQKCVFNLLCKFDHLMNVEYFLLMVPFIYFPKNLTFYMKLNNKNTIANNIDRLKTFVSSCW